MTGQSDSASAGDSFRLSFEGLSEALLQTGSPVVLRLFSRHFSLWPFSEVPAAEKGQVFLTLEEKGAGFRSIFSNGHRVDFATAAEMLCDTGIDLAEAFIQSKNGIQCLHCAAVSMKGQLVVLPNVNRAGKSLLAASLLLHGGRVFADDLLGVTPEGMGMSFGLPPRLRLPLPPSSVRLAHELSIRPGLSDRHYHFLYAKKDEVAAFGEQLPIGAIVMPHRIPGGEPCLCRLTPSAALTCMAYQFQMEEGQAEEVFALASRLCHRLPLWVLNYDSPEEASAYLMKECESLFCQSPLPGEAPALKDAAFLAESDRVRYSKKKRYSFPRSASVRWRQATGVGIHEEGSSVYLIPSKGNDIFYLDGIGPAVWALLASPLSAQEAASMLAEVFPEKGRGRIEVDMMHFFQTLFELDLLERCTD